MLLYFNVVGVKRIKELNTGCFGLEIPQVRVQ